MTIEQAIMAGWNIHPAPSLLWRIRAEAKRVVMAGDPKGYVLDPNNDRDLGRTESKHRAIGAEFRRRLREARIWVEGME